MKLRAVFRTKLGVFNRHCAWMPIPLRVFGGKVNQLFFEQHKCKKYQQIADQQPAKPAPDVAQSTWPWRDNVSHVRTRCESQQARKTNDRAGDSAYHGKSANVRRERPLLLRRLAVGIGRRSRSLQS